MKSRPLFAYFLVLAALSAAMIGGARMLGRQGAYLAQLYMLGPALAALITRLFWYPSRFSDALLRVGRMKDYVKYWFFSLIIVAMYVVAYSLLGAVGWDPTGSMFLARFAEQLAVSGQDINATLPPGITPRTMLLIFTVGGLTVFNIVPGIITGFGEEFGHRGFMFPALYRIRPWMGFVVGGLLWFAWHLPLAWVLPAAQQGGTPQAILNGLVLALGSVCTFTYLSYILVRSRSVFVTSVAHITMNNASTAVSYYAELRNQFLANLGIVVVMLLVVIVLFARGEFRVFASYFADRAAE